MLILFKILLASILFVASTGVFYSEWGKKHIILVVLAGTIGLVGTAYLGRDIYQRVKSDIVTELKQENTELPGLNSSTSAEKNETSTVLPSFMLSHIKTTGNSTYLTAKLKNQGEGAIQIWQCEGARMLPVQNIKSNRSGVLSFAVNTERNLIGILVAVSNKISLYAPYDLYAQEQLGTSAVLNGEHACDSFN